MEIIAKLEQLIVYYPGTHEIHYDPPSEGVIGTLLLQLPSLYQGQTKVLCEKCCYSECLQGGLASGEEFLYTAFRKDCKEISSDILLGNRVVLRYVLIQPLSQASFGNVPPSCDIQDLKLSFKKAIGELGSSFVAIGYQSETEPLANRFIDFVKSCRDDFGDPLCDIALGSIGYNSEYNRSQSGSLLRLIQPCSLHIDIWNNFPVGDPVTVLGNYSDKNSSMVVIWNSSNRIEVLEKLYLSGLVPKLFEALVVSSNSSLDVLVKLFHQISSKLQGQDLACVLDALSARNVPTEVYYEILTLTARISHSTAEHLLLALQTQTIPWQAMMKHFAELITNYGFCLNFCTLVNKLDFTQQMDLLQFPQFLSPKFSTFACFAEWVQYCKFVHKTDLVRDGLVGRINTDEIPLLLKLNMLCFMFDSEFDFQPSEFENITGLYSEDYPISGPLTEIFSLYERITSFGNSHINALIFSDIQLIGSSNDTVWQLFGRSSLMVHLSGELKNLLQQQYFCCKSAAMWEVVLQLVYQSNDSNLTLSLARSVLGLSELNCMPLKYAKELIIDPVIQSNDEELKKELAKKISYNSITSKESSRAKRQYWLYILFSLPDDFLDLLANAIISGVYCTNMPRKRILQLIDKISDPVRQQGLKNALAELILLKNYRASYIGFRVPTPELLWNRVVKPLLDLNCPSAHATLQGYLCLSNYGANVPHNEAWLGVWEFLLASGGNKQLAETIVQIERDFVQKPNFQNPNDIQWVQKQTSGFLATIGYVIPFILNSLSCDLPLVNCYIESLTSYNMPILNICLLNNLLDLCDAPKLFTQQTVETLLELAWTRSLPCLEANFDTSHSIDLSRWKIEGITYLDHFARWIRSSVHKEKFITLLLNHPPSHNVLKAITELDCVLELMSTQPIRRLIDYFRRDHIIVPPKIPKNN